MTSAAVPGEPERVVAADGEQVLAAGWEGGYEHLRARRVQDGIALVTLDLPQRRNMLSEAMTASWRRLVPALRSDAALRCVVVTGAGSAFCSGGDLSWVGGEPGATVDDLRARMITFYRDWLALRELEVPTIAAVNGPAVGAGLALACACDLRYAAEDAHLSAPFTTLGMHPGMGTTWFLPELAGTAVARELLLTGRALTGAEAAGTGLVNRAYPRERLLDEVLAIAERIAANAPVATRLTKQGLTEGRGGLEAALRREALAQAVTLGMSDLQEGLAAQRERRRPRFTGR